MLNKNIINIRVKFTPYSNIENTINERTTLYVGLIAVSGLLTLGFYYLHSRFLHETEKSV